MRAQNTLEDVTFSSLLLLVKRKVKVKDILENVTYFAPSHILVKRKGKAQARSLVQSPPFGSGLLINASVANLQRQLRSHKEDAEKKCNTVQVDRH